MITLEDCTAFCDAPEPEIARIAREQKLTTVVAIACAHSRHAARAEGRFPAPQRAQQAVPPTACRAEAAGTFSA
ncbi:MAG: hypothetical protein EYC67_01920 [Betaproteobacteria bacterium]|nr:MAG: hypothetical protein EYC67_01920 [Betaproteobacteria bacterium]